MRVRPLPAPPQSPARPCAGRRTPVASRLAALAAAALLAGGCASVDDPRDPLEPINRAVFEFNETVDRNVLKPVAQAYADTVPQTARTGVSNFFGNLYDFWNAVNNLLQGKVSTALSDVGRIALNTTVGLLGVVDVASRVGLEKSNEDIGQTLGWWGLGPGPYIVIPFLGPSSLRDGVGVVTEIVYDPLTRWTDDEAGWRWSLWGLRIVSFRASLLGTERILDVAATDRYAFVRDAYFQRRRNLIWDGRPPRDPDESRRQVPSRSVVSLESPWIRLPAHERAVVPADPTLEAPSATIDRSPDIADPDAGRIAQRS